MLTRIKLTHGGEVRSIAYETLTYRIVVLRRGLDPSRNVSFTEKNRGIGLLDRPVSITRASAARILRCTLMIMAGRGAEANILAGAPL